MDGVLSLCTSVAGLPEVSEYSIVRKIERRSYQHEESDAESAHGRKDQ